MDALARSLQSMRLRDGQPDHQARKAELNNLIPVLSHWEIRQLKTQLSQIKMNFDICSHLPTELLLLVANHLNLEDVIKGRCVSRSWNRILSTPDFCLGMVKKHFRSVWEKEYKNLGSIEQVKAKERLHLWFTKAALQRIRRQKGLYHSAAEFQNASSTGGPAQYCNGRVAMRESRNSFLVKSLFSEEVLCFTDENRTPTEEFWLGDQYLLALSKSPHILWAGSLNPASGTPEQFSVRLPNTIKDLSMCENKVAIIAPPNVFTWTIGKGMREVEHPSIFPEKLNETNEHPFSIVPALKKPTTRILFPPHDSTRFFIATFATQKIINSVLSLMELIIHEFTSNENQYNHHSSHTTQLILILKNQEPITSLNLLEPTHLSIRFTDESQIGIWMRNPKFELQPSPPPSEIPRGPSTLGSQEIISVITFNIYTNHFGTQTYQIPSPPPQAKNHPLPTPPNFLWRNQAYLLNPYVDSPPHLSFSPEPEPLLVAIHSSSPSPPPTPTLYPLPPSPNPQTDPFSSQLRYSDLLYISGDDNYLVIIGPWAFRVWCFNGTISLSKAGASEG